MVLEKVDPEASKSDKPSMQQDKPKKEIWQVVTQLPTQEVRQTKQEDGTIVNFITVEEYLTMQANARLQ